MNTNTNTQTDEFIENLYELIESKLNTKGDIDIQYFDTIKVLPTSDNINIKSMLDDIANNDYTLSYLIDDQNAFDYGNYFGDINIFVNGSLKYILEMVLGKDYIDYDYVGLNIYGREWRTRIN